MMRLVFGLVPLLCIVGCSMRRPASADTVVSVAVTGDIGVEFDAEYTWSDGKTDTIDDTVRDRGNGTAGVRAFHNGVSDDRRIVCLTVRSLSQGGKIGVIVERVKNDRGATVVFEGRASGTGAEIVYRRPMI